MATFKEGGASRKYNVGVKGFPEINVSLVDGESQHLHIVDQSNASIITHSRSGPHNQDESHAPSHAPSPGGCPHSPPQCGEGETAARVL